MANNHTIELLHSLMCLISILVADKCKTAGFTRPKHMQMKNQIKGPGKIQYIR